MFCVDLPTLRKMLVVASKIGGQHLTPPEPSAMSKGTTTKARRQAIEIPTFRMSPDSDTGPFSRQENENGRPL